MKTTVLINKELHLHSAHINVKNLVVLTLFFLLSYISKGATITSTATGGAWNATTTWVGGVVPATTDNAIIATGATVNLTAAATAVNVTVNAGGTLSIATQILTVTGTFANNGTLNGTTGRLYFGGNVTTMGTHTLTGTQIRFTGAAAQSIASFTTTGIVNMVKNGGTATLTGNISCGGITINSTGGSVLNLGTALTHTTTGVVTLTRGTLNGGSSTLNVNVVSTTAWNGSGTVFVSGTGTVNFGAAGNQTLSNNPVTNFNNLTFSNTGTKTITTARCQVNNILSMEGNAVLSAAPTYGAAATLRYNRTAARAAGVEWITPFVATGGVQVTNTGTITMNAAKVFNASIPLSIATGATLATGNFQLTLGGNFTNSGTFTAGSSAIVINNTMATQSISGFTTTGLVSMTKTAGVATFTSNVTSAGLTINGTGGTLNLGAALTHTSSGVITLTAGSLNGGSSTLNVNAVSATAWNGTGTVFTAGTSTVNFGAAGAQTLSASATTFYNLTFSNSGVKTLTTANCTATNTVSMEGTATVSAAPTYGSAAKLIYNTATARTAGVEWITPFAATGGVVIANTGIITMNNAKVFNTSIPLTINTGATLATNNFQLNLGGDFNRLGNFTAGSSAVVIEGTMATQTIVGFTTTGVVSMTKTSGTATFTANVTAAGLTINGTGGALHLGTGLTHTISTTLTRTAGTLNGGASTLQLAGTVSGTGGTFDAGTGTFEYTGAAQSIAVLPYYNLTLSGSGTKTFSATTTVTNTISINSGTIANLTAGLTHTTNGLILGGVVRASGSWGGTGSGATNINATFFTATTGKINNNCSVPTITSQPSAPITTCSGSGVQVLSVTATGAGLTYSWRKGGVAVLNGAVISGQGTATLTLTNPILSDAGSYDVVITGTCASSVTSNAVSVVVDVPLTAGVLTPSPATSSVCDGTNVSVTATAGTGGIGTVMDELEVSLSGGAFVAYTSGSPIATAGETAVTVRTRRTATGPGCTTSSYNTVSWTINPSLPASVIIATASTTVCDGELVEFTATPTHGGASPSYQWKINGINVGTDNPIFSTTDLLNGDQVTVVMTSNATPCLVNSPATSNTITMTVNPLVLASVTISTASTTVCEGASVTFTATPTNGGTSPAYQWQIDGNDVIGETSSTFTTSTLLDGEVVSVVMDSNDISPCLIGSSISSNEITMTVLPYTPVSVSIVASATTICAGTSVTFTATPTNGGSTPSYQWKVNGNNVGTDNALYTTTALQNGDVVTVVMTSNASPCLTGSPATSNTVTMTVNPLATASITASNGPSQCYGSDISFTVSGTTNAILYYNLNGGGTQFTVLTGGSATITVTGATASQTLNLVSVDNGQCPVTLSETATVAVNTTTWDGTAWSNGAPDATTAAFVTGNLTIASNLQACALVISNNAIVSVASGSNVTLQNALSVASGSSFTVNSNANLIQVNPNAVNSGNIVVKRASNPLIRLDYILWGSPVAGQNLFNFSPLTSVNPNIRFYQYNPSTNVYNTVSDYATHAMQAGKGYLIRLPFNHPTAAAVWNGSFTGVPNNGTYTVTLGNTGSGFGYNAVSNPYPSTLDIAQFYSDNASNVEPTLYFWRKTNNATKPSYCTWNMDTDTFVDNGEAYTESPNGIIQVGQGFFVEAKGSATSVVFNNTQRVGNNANQMFKTQGVATQNTEKHRIWLNITSGNDFAQAVVGYFSNGTLAADATDSKLFNDGNLALTTLIGTSQYVVNGRPVPFDAADVVPMSYKATTPGMMTIAIDRVDGLFTGGSQAIYLHDLADNTYHNLNAGPYVFQSQAGTFNSRFELVYQNALSTVSQELEANHFQVVRKEGTLHIQANEMMAQVIVFDLQGRVVVQQKNVNQQTIVLPGVIQDQVYLVRVITTTGKSGIKKVL
ncbi:hypothetical protein [Flavobacterium stagni]|uniref:Ig-like domain-containing protein n=1 Tax=Flavobacterium stagni TaxID=2506421 RepID=A0A4Q1K9A0_9FLAO|nr:hypothetical protein [Flavobacterium stagni]RXR22438.1 hypothetical protein EQG61_07590 [Flavobacterium stagni]